ncbi:MAG: hypothetical protein AAFU79_30500 [Myxococcota bacterium]
MNPEKSSHRGEGYDRVAGVDGCDQHQSQGDTKHPGHVASGEILLGKAARARPRPAEEGPVPQASNLAHV